MNMLARAGKEISLELGSLFLYEVITMENVKTK